MNEFVIRGEFIELFKLLKASALASSGGEAKMMIEDGIVSVNGAEELRKRRKLHPGDVVEIMGNQIAVIAAPDATAVEDGAATEDPAAND